MKSMKLMGPTGPMEPMGLQLVVSNRRDLGTHMVLTMGRGIDHYFIASLGLGIAKRVPIGGPYSPTRPMKPP